MRTSRPDYIVRVCLLNDFLRFLLALDVFEAADEDLEFPRLPFSKSIDDGCLPRVADETGNGP